MFANTRIKPKLKSLRNAIENYFVTNNNENFFSVKIDTMYIYDINEMDVSKTNFDATGKTCLIKIYFVCMLAFSGLL